MPVFRPLAWFTGGAPAPDRDVAPQPQPRSYEDERRMGMQEYLVSLSRNSPRGKAYAQKADSVRSMLREMKDTNDWKRRRAIVQTLKNKGFIE